MIFLLLTILVLLHSLAEVRGSCQTCQSNYAICHDERHFSMCADGISTDEMRTCPDEYLCTAETEICLKSTANDPVQPTCEKTCGLCDSPGKLFACISETVYVYCFGDDVPNYSASGACPAGYVCNLNSRQVCTSASEAYPSCYDGVTQNPTTLVPPTTTENSSPTEEIPSDPTDETSSTKDSTTSDSTITTDETSSSTDQISSSTERTSSTSEVTTIDDSTTPAVQTTSTTQNPRDETEFCRDKQLGGLYRSENDPTCQEFILCYVLSGQYLGLKYTCSGNTFFNEETNKCQSERPANC